MQSMIVIILYKTVKCWAKSNRISTTLLSTLVTMSSRLQIGLLQAPNIMDINSDQY